MELLTISLISVEWSVIVDEDCWKRCDSTGGSCSSCDLHGDDGYCCSATKFDKNGNCPTDAVNAVKGSSDDQMHQCVQKIKTGKRIS